MCKLICKAGQRTFATWRSTISDDLNGPCRRHADLAPPRPAEYPSSCDVPCHEAPQPDVRHN